MTMMPPFTPGPTANATSGAGSSSTATALARTGQQVLITSESGGTQAKAFIKFGDSTVQAAATDTPILPGTTQIFTPPSSATHFAVFSAAATLVYATSGIGE
jgi:hypothetical protein